MLDDLRSVTQAGVPLSRRGFVVTSLATGFAAATKPVSAQTITTDTNGIVAGEVKIPVVDGEIPAYRAKPADGSRFATVLVIQEIFGVHEHIKDVTRRFAKAGYLAIAPQLYARQGDVSKLSDVQQIMENVVSRVPDRQVLADLDAAANWATNVDQGDRSRLGLTGFCWGGRIVWLYAAHNPDLKAGVAWYGRISAPSTEMTPRHPIDIANELKAPVLGLYGGADAGIPNDTVENMRRATKAAAKPAEILTYPDTPHGFHADYRPSYRPEQAKDGWNRLQRWFKQYGVA